LGEETLRFRPDAQLIFLQLHHQQWFFYVYPAWIYIQQRYKSLPMGLTSEMTVQSKKKEGSKSPISMIKPKAILFKYLFVF